MEYTVRGDVKQVTPEVVSGDDQTIQLSKLGAIFTHDWKNRLAAAGLVYSAHIGTLTTGADVGLITGGGAGTTVDSDQPEFHVGVDTGYYLIPIDFKATCVVDADANAEYGEILLFADRSQAPPTSVTGTPGIITPNNQLDGGGAFPGRCYGGITADITDPIMSELLDFEYLSTSEFVSNGTATNLTNGIVLVLKMHYAPEVPPILAGPCGIVLCYGGTAAVTGMVIAQFACVPATYFPVS